MVTGKKLYEAKNNNNNQNVVDTIDVQVVINRRIERERRKGRAIQRVASTEIVEKDTLQRE